MSSRNTLSYDTNRSDTENQSEDSNRMMQSSSSFTRTVYELSNVREESNLNHRFHPDRINDHSFNASRTNSHGINPESISDNNSSNNILENLQRSFSSQERSGHNLFNPISSSSPILNRPAALSNHTPMPEPLHMSSDSISHQDATPESALVSSRSSDYTQSFRNLTEYERFIYTKFSGKLDEDINNDSNQISVPIPENRSQHHTADERNQVRDKSSPETYNQNRQNDSVLTNFDDENQSIPIPTQIQSSSHRATLQSQSSSVMETPQYSNPSNNTHRPPIFHGKQNPSIDSTIFKMKKPNISGLTTTSCDPSFQKIKIPELMVGERGEAISAGISNTARNIDAFNQNTNDDNGIDYERHFIRCLKCKENLRVHKLVSLVICPCCRAVSPNTKIEATMTMVSKCAFEM